MFKPAIFFQWQVTALRALTHWLYVGTSLGSLVVVDALSMRPATIFRPYQVSVRLIIELIENVFRLNHPLVYHKTTISTS